MLLKDRVAVIHGAGGAIGGAVARALAREGAEVFLAGRTRSKLEAVARDIRSRGGMADSAVVDALDERAVNEYVDEVVKQAGRIDISVNVIGIGDIQKPLMEISVDEFIQPIATAMRTHFVTGKAAARHMIGRGSGVLLTFGGSGPQTLPGLGGFKVALDAIAGLRRQWACELGEHGIRVVTLRSGGIPETIPDTFAGSDEIVAEIVRGTLLNRAATLDDVGNVAAFIASDQARSVTDTEINISCGAMVD